MPKDEPDPSDPLELRAVQIDDPTGESLQAMATCLAEEFLRLGWEPARVEGLFEQP